jgi:hypothetical protein
MFRASRAVVSGSRSGFGLIQYSSQRLIATHEHVPRKDGDISSVFRSLSGSDDTEQLPQRFADVKRKLVNDKFVLHQSWNRLLARLREEAEEIRARGSACLPEIDFSDIRNPSQEFQDSLRQRGVAIVRQVVPEKEAREYKEEAERYIASNPATKGKGHGLLRQMICSPHVSYLVSCSRSTYEITMPVDVSC